MGSLPIASILVFGFLLGMRHALDADHLAAVASLATRSRSLAQSVGHGIAWGVGHTLTLLAFGGAVLMLGLSVPLQTAHALELAVGMMLVLLGMEVLYRLWRDRIHFHRHSHATAIVHFHAHSHRGERTAHDPDRHRHQHLRSLPARALVVGMVHGLSGSAALILLSLEASQSVHWGVAYLAMFGAGSIAGMAVVSAAIAVPLRLTSSRLTWAQGSLSTIVGIANIGLGCYIVYQSASASFVPVG
jgi:hypothetical protein